MAGRFPIDVLLVAISVIASSTLAGSVEADPRVGHTRGASTKKGDAPASVLEETPLMATLVQTHTSERVPLDRVGPANARFDALLADRATGAKSALDPRLLDLLRTLVAGLRAENPLAPLPRIELVSGFRSPKLNEMLRKKGHHVASHSQHSLGHAVDFRIVLDGETRGIDPRALAKAIRAAGWNGGVGIYLLKDDWFVHADVGPNRSWYE